MSSYSLKMLFAMLVCLFHTQVSILGFISQSHSSNVKCNERERQALLNLKHGLTDRYGVLSTWSDDDNNTDCCNWKGIQCNNQTGHVQMLDLRGYRPQFLIGPINTTSLIALHNIEHLDLSYNLLDLSSPQLLGSVPNLRYLNLSWWGGLYGRIPYELGNLSKLEYLDLSNNDLNGAIPYQLGNLSQLKYLDLRWNSLDGTIPFQVGNLPILHTLRLGGNFYLKINDAKWISSLSSLTTLGLSSLTDLVSSRHWLQMISELIPKLWELRLVNCSLSDDNISSLFPSHSNLSTPLSILDLSNNMLTSSTFQLLSNYSLNLQELYLGDNNILSSPHFPNFPSLVILDLSGNNLTSLIFQESFNISSKLRELQLVDCSLTDRSFLVPTTSIQNSSSSSLVTLNLSFNHLTSSAIFNWLFNFTANLQSLSLGDNLLEGTIPDGFGKVMSSLQVAHLGSNKLQGKIPASLGNICTLMDLDISHNNLSGGISSFIRNSFWCKRHTFQILDLSHNQITGMLPDLSIFTYLRILDVSNNRLTGEIPKNIGLLHELEYLLLHENYLEGDIIELHLTNLFKLKYLDLTDNLLSLKFGATWVPAFQLFSLGLASCKLGPNFPHWLQSQSHFLNFLDISHAGIDDFVPEWFWNKLQFITRMNVSYNSLKGIIPNLPLKLPDGQFLILNSNQFEGEIPGFLSQAYALDLSGNKISDLNTFLCGKNKTTNMATLDLSNNQIRGHLPDCWEHLNALQFLDLSNNKLSGKIPQSMGTLVFLEALVLRNNNLIGELPISLKNCISLDKLDLSENLLSGPIPSWIGESLQELEILSLRVNHFFGTVPVHLCYLNQIHVLDLSRNHLSGGIPTCLRNFTAMNESRVITNYNMERERKVSYENYDPYIYDSDVLLNWKGTEQVFFNPEILLSIDLSSNDLTGEIPKEVGCLFGLVSLNLARNNLNGEIPPEIGNLNQLDFLDLSRNHFSGRIPSTISKIDGLGYLNLSYNDLSRKIPSEGHLQTFDASSFEGNLGLCGQQLKKSCPGDDTGVQPQGHAVHGEDDNLIFYEALYMSLGLGFFIGFWGLLGPILLWKPWRNAYGRFLNILTDHIFVTVEVNVTKCHRWLKG